MTGTCLFDGTDYLKIAPKTTGAVRMQEIRGAVTRFLGDQPEPPTIFIEDFAFSRATRAHDKGGLGWILRMEFIDQGWETWLIKPNLRAKFATGKGNANKAAVVSATSARTGIVFPDDDHCDAFVLWCMGKQHLIEDHSMGKLPQTHLDAMDKVIPLQ